MIIARSPMRISLGGGGTDLPSYYSRFSGFFLSAAIDKYMYVMVHQSWNDEYVIKYSQLERAKKVTEIRHPIVRTALEQLEIGPNIEICSMADIPAGTGLGSSGSFTTALLKALYAHKRNYWLSPHDLAEKACKIEIEYLKEPVGKQDPFIAAYGGVTCFDVTTNGTVEAKPAKISKETLYSLEDNLAIFFTGYSRSASEVLKDQDDRTNKSESDILDNLHFTKELGFRIKNALEGGDLRGFGELMHEHWQHKQKRSKGISNDRINELYKLAMDNGAVGGKLIGAGGGGFLMFYSEDKLRLRQAMHNVNVEELRFKLDFSGTKLMVS